MIRNFILSAIRNIRRNRFYTVLNILGLSVGLAAFIFILLFVRDEMTYDRHHERHERIFRIESDFTISDRHDRFAIVPVPMGPAFELEFPEVEESVRFANIGNTLFRFREKEYYEEDFYFTDSTIFDVFTHPFVIGSPEKALSEPFTIVMTQSTARKYFGDKNPVGEMLETGQGKSYKVTGVIEDLPGNSHLKFDALMSVSSLEKLFGADRFNSMEPDNFWNIGVYTYILLNHNASMTTIMEKFPAFYDKYMRPVGDQINASFIIVHRPLADTHFTTGMGSDRPNGSKTYAYIFSAIALFILLLAAINYMNMATARSANRAREVGMRKVSGAYRSQLIWQFVTESIFFAVLALVIAVILVAIFLDDFNLISGKTLAISQVLQPLMLFMIIGIAVLVGFVSGIYPAFYLSSFQPIAVLKGSAGKRGRSTGLLRRSLVVLQFFIAIVMIIGTLVVSRQLRFLQDKDLGFDKENLVMLELQDSTFRSKAESFMKELMNGPGILATTNCTGVPGQIDWIQVVRAEQQEGLKDMALILAQVDYDYLKTMGMEIVNGRDFDRNMGTDATEAVIINETGVKTLGWEDDPIGKKIQYGFDLQGDQGRMLKVIGVVRDFHFTSLHNKIEPIILFISEVPRYRTVVRIDESRKKDALDYIEQKWNEFGAGRPFDYIMLEDSLDDMYQAEQKLSLIFKIATGLTIFIALLGMLGLSSFIAERKTKEIGIRKIVGATMPDISRLLYKEFILLILAGFVLAIPIAWWRLDIWLKDTFIYYAPMHWTSFVWAGLLAIAIGIGTISFHILRAASSNPVEAIKYE